jgi:hypothetical protein
MLQRSHSYPDSTFEQRLAEHKAILKKGSPAKIWTEAG